MISKMLNAITGLLAILLVSVFVLGLSHSISTGFAGFWGGFPFMVIALFVLALAAYDYWNVCIRSDD
ncbi:MAG: hypothetical protein WBO55_00295 [Rhizobiaceae bacterium]